MTMIYLKTIFAGVACAVALSGLATTAPAMAKGKRITVTAPAGDDVPTRRVTYADLNLASSHGEKTLLRRVGMAVGQVCNPSVGNSHNRFLEMDCRGQAWAGARPQIARAVQRARDIAFTGYSAIPPVAISISIPGN